MSMFGFGKKEKKDKKRTEPGLDAELKRFAADYQTEELDILAVTGPVGFGGGKRGSFWQASIGLAAWMEEETFYREYAALIDDLRRIQPHVPIYLQTIIPVTLSRAAARAPGNDLLAHHSQLLVRLAREKRVYLVDTAAPLTGSNGALPSDYSADGLHLSDEGNKVWLDCLRTHTME